MTINFSTKEIAIGDHSLRIQVTNLSGVVFEETWDILISPQIRESMPIALIPTAQHFQQNPESIPEFIQYVDFSTRYIDRFSYHEFPYGEGICIYPEQVVISSIIGSRIYNEVVQISIDGEMLSEDQVSIVLDERMSICVESNYLENGLHLATFTLLIDPPRSYTWVFSAEP